ncbi:MAG TPA: FeoB-associated Cys-rich membrane protein [Clostridia bacterium]|jgi:hypothetical protein|nr:FeoB-associated Cys-rich membrane protein [Clostridiaceae bacterium]HOF26460.1 FeoB-associated Cys-rich membrane protein [Clostridia bacterium]HOM34080.1 FeoB-associated Cys-rich membrane protein [Clostridia bacterium]HOR89659.1 FeoB-associated Cys-rich membrane protein [Clostridia bacterium]HOT71167.1 FeoB-associated Cys-rich membrane protein [Clostridia bacterium]
MKEFILENLATVIISLVLLSVVTLIVVSMIRNKKKNKSICAGCPMAGNCSKGKG